MLILTAKVPRRRLALGAAMAAFLCCTVLALSLFPPDTAQAAAFPDGKGVRTNQDRIAYLQSFGWQLKETPAATQELQIPQAFDDSYTEYLSLQSSQGFDLSRYAGKRIKRYTYEITNYPTGEQGVIVNLLLHKATVVGGEVLSPKLDGFLHGLAMP